MWVLTLFAFCFCQNYKSRHLSVEYGLYVICILSENRLRLKKYYLRRRQTGPPTNFLGIFWIRKRVHTQEPAFRRGSLWGDLNPARICLLGVWTRIISIPCRTTIPRRSAAGRVIFEIVKL
jgi:hypothetical protein